MSASVAKLLAYHQAFWTYDPWYRRGWFIWPQALSLTAAMMLLSPSDRSAPAAGWVKPIDGQQGPAPSADFLLCSNVQTEAKARAEACDKIIKAGTLPPSQLATAYFGRAYYRSNNNDVDGAIADYNESLRLVSSSYQALNNRGSLYLRKNNPSAALKDLDEAVKIAPQDALTWANRAEAKRQLRMLAEAQSDANKAIEIDSKLAYARTVRDTILGDLKRLEGGTPAPKNPMSPSQLLASVQQQAGAQPQAGTNAPDYKLCVDNNADLAQRGAACDRLINGGALTGNPLSYAFFGRGYWRQNTNQPDLAIADYTESLRWDPDDAIVYRNRGNQYLAKSDYDKALSDYDRSIQLKPESTFGYLGRGQVHFYRSAALREQCKQQTAPANASVLTGGPCARPLNFNDAFADFRTALAKDPAQAAAHFFIGQVHVKLQQTQQAVDAFTAAIRISPNYSVAYNNRGVEYGKLRQLDLARADFDEAIRSDPRNSTAYTNRADVNVVMKHRQQAIADYRKALDINGNNAVARAGLAKLGVKP